MPADLALTVMRHNEGWVNSLNDLFKGSDLGETVNIDCQEIDYDTGWTEFMRTAIHGGNLDLSEMGTSWINDFIAMNALRPFSPADIRELGGEGSFPPGLWRSGVDEHGVAWAIPWMTDISLVYYRRSLLQKAGVREDEAFSSPEKFEETLDRLGAAQVQTPWTVPSRHSYITLHNLSMWLWHNGVDFVDDTNKSVVLKEPKARAAVRSYFGLCRFLSENAHNLNERESDSLFASGGAAVTISGPWLYRYCDAGILDDVRLAIPLGMAYLGGSGLVMWNSGHLWGESSKLIHFLTSQKVQETLPQLAGALPARIQVLERVPFAKNPDLNQVVIQALKNGRSFPHLPLWGMIEDRLAKTFENLWAVLLTDPGSDLDDLLELRLDPDVDRLNIIMSK